MYTWYYRVLLRFSVLIQVSVLPWSINIAQMATTESTTTVLWHNSRSSSISIQSVAVCRYFGSLSSERNPDFTATDGGLSHLGVEAAQRLDQVGGPAHVEDGGGAALLPLADAVVKAEQVGETFRVLKCGERRGLLGELLETTRTRFFRRFSRRISRPAFSNSPLNNSGRVSVLGTCLSGLWSIPYVSRYTTNNPIHLRCNTNQPLVRCGAIQHSLIQALSFWCDLMTMW